ncbi:MAG: hypothetical protein K6T26_04195 [Alicyclobacillus sp.]|nr:hypothetical protein [Alicyclobacillus sp.]
MKRHIPQLTLAATVWMVGLACAAPVVWADARPAADGSPLTLYSLVHATGKPGPADHPEGLRQDHGEADDQPSGKADNGHHTADRGLHLGQWLGHGHTTAQSPAPVDATGSVTISPATPAGTPPFNTSTPTAGAPASAVVTLRAGDAASLNPQQALANAAAAWRQDQQAEQTARNQLVQAARQFIQAMQLAVEAGDSRAVDTGMSGQAAVLAALNSALTAQSQVATSAQNWQQLQGQGSLQAALSAWATADSRLQAQTQAMQAAAASLFNLANQVRTQAQATLSAQP